MALWIVCICAGVLVHLALALAYWAELDGESRYDMGGAFMANMQVSIMPDMGQGIAGGNRDIMANGDGEEADSEPTSAQEPAPEPSEAVADVRADVMADAASTQAQANEPELEEQSEPEGGSSDAIEPEPSVEPNNPEAIDATEMVAPDDETVSADKTRIEADPNTEPELQTALTEPVVATKEPEPQSLKPVTPPTAEPETGLQAVDKPVQRQEHKQEEALAEVSRPEPEALPETKPTEPDEPDDLQSEEGTDLVDPVSEPEPEPRFAPKLAVKSETQPTPDPAPQPEVEMAVEDERTDPAQPVMLPKSAPVGVAETETEEGRSEDEAEPAQHVSLMQGGALTALPASAPRAKIKAAPAPKRLRVAKAEGLKDGGGSQTARSSSSRKAAGAAQHSGHSPKASVRGDGGTSNKVGGAGSRGVRASYATQLRRWIERHKRYPRSAKMRGVQGQGVVRIVINQSGRVLKSTLIKSAGDRYLDDEIRSLPMRASPAPKPPKEFSGARHTLTLPVRFSK
nr:TonB family protein [uncultured Cohaesibacter sp.]